MNIVLKPLNKEEANELLESSKVRSRLPENAIMAIAQCFRNQIRIDEGEHWPGEEN